MRLRSRLTCGVAMSALAAALVGGSPASAASPQACGLVPPTVLAGDLGMAHIIESAAITPDSGSGGRVARCRITAWQGERAKAAVTAGTLARLTLETAEEDSGSPFASRWAAGGALQQRHEREAQFEELVAEAEGFVTERHVGAELWDHEHADAPGFNLSGYGENDNHGKRDIFVTWRASQPIGRSLALNLILDEREHVFLEVNKIAEVAIPAFTITPGEFGSPAPPSPEPPSRPVARYRFCPGAQVTGTDGVAYGHFEVKDTSCHEVVAIMRHYLAAQARPSASRRIEGWTVEPSGTDAYLARKGRARFACYVNPG